MPCSDSSSSMTIHLDPNERFIDFEYAKITCGQDITKGESLSAHFRGRSLTEILELTFEGICRDLQMQDEEKKFLLFLQWDALRCAIALYLGIENPRIDTDRCLISSIEYHDRGIEVAEVILPPRELPKILPCALTRSGNHLR